ncbi:xylulokinase [Inediibacterium massiliense]|uniref:xylulokinase n=1 Tax=Inediibacterium massiliense TaxID=1658111 RepID=UPI0006B46245|nr:xylulokinase [Inediibacterium massiliense]
MIYIGIDLGTSSVKLLALNENGNILGEVTKEYPVYYPKSNWAEQNPEDWWNQTKQGLKELINRYDLPKDQIQSIGFSGQMHGLVALDENGEVLLPAILWNDQRTVDECIEIENHFGQEKLTQFVGNKALTGFTAPKILWLKKNHKEVFEKVQHILLPKDYIRYRLTKDYATDVSDASGMLLLDVKNRKWSKEMIEFLGIHVDMLPKVYESYEVTGVLSDEIKQYLEIENEVLVVGGASDQAAGAIGTGTVEDGIISITLGTSGVVFASCDEFVVDDENRLHSFCHGNGKYHLMGVMLSAASCLKWWVEDVNCGVSFEELLQEAQESEVGANGVIFLPYLMGERTPYADPDAKGTFIGLNMKVKRGDLTRAVLEGVSFGLRDSLEILKDLNIPIHQIRVIGGGAKSQLWKQILANILNHSIDEINTNQGGALGAAILAAVGVGKYKNVEIGCKTLIKRINQINPQKEFVNTYEQIYKKYQLLYGSLKDWFKS